MKNLRLFKAEESYLNEKSSFEYPTVSYVKDTNKVYYHKNNYVEAYYIIEDVNSETPLLNYYFVEQDFIKKMEIQYEDGTTEIVNEGDGDFDNTYEAFATHQFSQTGNVGVRFYMKNNWNNASGMFAIKDILIPVAAINFEKADMSNISSLAGLCYYGIQSDSGYSGYGGYGSSDGSSIESKLEYVTFGNNKTLKNAQDVAVMFFGCSNLKYVDVSCVDASNTNGDERLMVFEGCSSLETLKYFKKTSERAITLPTSIVNVDFNAWDSSNVTDMSSMFSNCGSLTSLDLSNFDTSNVTNMSSMFFSCFNLTSLDLSNFDTSKVTDMGQMFGRCNNLYDMAQVIGFDKFDTANVTDMSGMFIGCKLTSINLNHFNTANVANMGMMFRECSGLTSLDLSNFDTSNVTDMGQMFAWCYELTSITFGSQADVSKVTDYGAMFGSIAATGTLYYPLAYADTWSNIITPNTLGSAIPVTWTTTAIDYESQSNII